MNTLTRLTAKLTNMFKRSKSYLLLTLLVLTGFGGRIHSDTLTGKERKTLLADLKQTKKDFLHSVKDLSEEQLNFKPDANTWSVKECAYHIALSEYNLWSAVASALKEDPNADKRKEVKMTDEQVSKMIRDRSVKVKTSEAFEPSGAKFKNLDEALRDFKEKRTDLVKYVKTTTDNLRDHVVTLPFATFDSYQFLLFLSAHTNRHTQQIDEVKAHPRFPK